MRCVLGQWKNKCSTVSNLSLHCLHIPSILIPFFFKQAPTEIQIIPGSPKEMLYFLFYVQAPNFPQSFLSSSTVVLDHSSHSTLFLFSFPIFYTEFIENCPLGVCFHISLSLTPKELIGKLRIATISTSLLGLLSTTCSILHSLGSLDL